MASEIETIVLRIKMDTSALDKGNRSLFTTKKNADKASRSVAKMASAFIAAFASIATAVKSSNISREFDKIDGALNTLFGSVEQANKEFDFLAKTSDELGLVTLEIANGYSKLVASMYGANISAEDQRDIFKAVTTAGTALGKSTDEINGVLTAFGQIASKGKVQSEELLQIAERNIPVNALLAKAMGLTVQEMKEQVATGNVLASDILPKLANVMQNEYAKGALANANKDTARFNRITNQLNESLRKMGILVNEVVLALGEGAVGKASDAFDDLLEVVLQVSDDALPSLLTIGGAVFDGLDTLVRSFGEIFLSVISAVGEGWELLFSQITGEDNFINSITDSIAIAARAWPQLLTQPFLVAFKFITEGLVQLEELFFKVTDKIEEGALTANLAFASSFGSKEDQNVAQGALELFFDEQANREPIGDTFLKDLDKTVADLIKDSQQTIQDVADQTVEERLENEEKINDLILKIRQRFEKTLGEINNTTSRATGTAVAGLQGAIAAPKAGLELGTAQAAEFLVRPTKDTNKIAKESLDIQKKSLEEQKKQTDALNNLNSIQGHG